MDASARTGLHEHLREASRASHRALDRHRVLAPLMRSDLTAAQYGDALAALHGVYAPLEAEIDRFLATGAAVFDDASRRKLPQAPVARPAARNAGGRSLVAPKPREPGSGGGLPEGIRRARPRDSEVRAGPSAASRRLRRSRPPRRGREAAARRRRVPPPRPASENPRKFLFPRFVIFQRLASKPKSVEPGPYRAPPSISCLFRGPQ